MNSWALDSPLSLTSCVRFSRQPFTVYRDFRYHVRVMCVLFGRGRQVQVPRSGFSLCLQRLNGPICCHHAFSFMPCTWALVVFGGFRFRSGLSVFFPARARASLGASPTLVHLCHLREVKLACARLLFLFVSPSLPLPSVCLFRLYCCLLCFCLFSSVLRTCACVLLAALLCAPCWNRGCAGILLLCGASDESGIFAPKKGKKAPRKHSKKKGRPVQVFQHLQFLASTSYLVQLRERAAVSVRRRPPFQSIK